jgi:hypothetical protein
MTSKTSGVASASTIMIATSPSSSRRPATTMSKVASASSLWLGKAIQPAAVRATRVAPTGPVNGRPDSSTDGRGAVDGEHVVQVVGVQRHDRRDDLDLVAQALLEGRAQRRSVRRQVRIASSDGPALTPEERAGDPARGVHPLLDVDRQREEVQVLLGPLAGGGRRQQHGVAQVGGDGAGGLLGQPPGLEPDDALAGGVLDDGVDELAAVDVALALSLVQGSSPLHCAPAAKGTRCSVEAVGARCSSSGRHSRGPGPRVRSGSSESQDRASYDEGERPVGTPLSCD